MLICILMSPQESVIFSGYYSNINFVFRKQGVDYGDQL